ncbi:MAG: AzlD domain-containing protein [Anaerolineae bacterium]|jgi:branched-subunit amino acid transport protein|nr:AzlD domain-containing protein [Anaerolineae bacterium]MCZ7553420.1 AzlD domain-containing protein [Anaerolineales bacterium]
MSIWLVYLFSGLITYATRLSFIVLVDHKRMPPWLRRALRFIPPAVLTAIIFPEVLLREGDLFVSLGNARLLAGLAAALVAWRTRNALLTIVIGMAALWLIQWLM